MNWVIIYSCNGLSRLWRQAITWTNKDSWLIQPLGLNFNEIIIAIQTFSLKEMHLKSDDVCEILSWP